MTATDAIQLIKNAITASDEPQVWADLGCGSGVFTNALAHLLPAGSSIYAVDALPQKLPRTMGNHVAIDFLKADFSTSDLNYSHLDGILMANSLHFVKDKTILVSRLRKYLKENKKFIIIEYETNAANQWVPYPVCFSDLKKLFIQSGATKIEQIGTRASIFGQDYLYAAVIQSTI